MALDRITSSPSIGGAAVFAAMSSIRQRRSIPT
eukprot:CAMPEP_0203953566 /NCGR_PEP_ID=MMETSP0359-20131031/86906_1 /ASSEMBLY_ACC=CAM_ASM_000338 /TAXON_ID=268821 /ORGANISM="Scrippsiella Hangoei, Strain SHTV-5" /LENGTH=32 /DNA_ID= /DNA_START= /DNA_END= /DNA_ORIENTATION=